MAISDDKPDARPLYDRVRQQLIDRIQTGVLKPGEALPSEFALADELGVSQGTARKALDGLARDRLIVRRQGRGTFVAEQTPAEVLFRFFKIYTEAGARVQPTSRDVRVANTAANAREAAKLPVKRGERVIRITRTRLNGDVPIIRETVVVAAKTFPGFGASGDVPNTIYDVFQQSYGITVARADEDVEAVAAGVRDARYLGVVPGKPLLRIDRIAFDLNDRPIEWRVSICHLKGLHYRAELR